MAIKVSQNEEISGGRKNGKRKRVGSAIRRRRRASSGAGLPLTGWSDSSVHFSLLRCCCNRPKKNRQAVGMKASQFQTLRAKALIIWNKVVQKVFKYLVCIFEKWPGNRSFPLDTY